MKLMKRQFVPGRHARRTQRRIHRARIRDALLFRLKGRHRRAIDRRETRPGRHTSRHRARIY